MNDDLISRQAAIQALCQECAQGGYDKCNVDCIEAEVLRKLPPVELKPVYEDAISRVDALKAICAECNVNCEDGTDKEAHCTEYAVINDMPPVEPRDKDAISREGLLKSWEELSPRGRTEFDQVIMTIPALPQVEPKRPKRIETMIVDGEPTEIDPLSYEVGYSHGQSERPKGKWEVVRCGECERWECILNTKNYGLCRKVSYDDCHFEVVMERDDFCSYGIRRKDGEA